MLGAALVLAAAGAQARFATVDITPAAPLPMGGYTARGDALGSAGEERITARVLLLSEGSRKAALVSLEGLTIPESLVREVRARVPANTGLFLAATHTHSAPDTQMLNDRMTFRIPGIAIFNPAELKRVADLIASAVSQAEEAPAQPGEWELTEAAAALNRGRRDGALPDQTVWRLAKGGRAALGAYAAHATLLSEDRLTWSGDWPGAWMRRRNSPVFAGAIGDVSPVAESPEAMADALEAASGQGRSLGEPSFCFESEPIALGPRAAAPSFAQEFGAPSALGQLLVSRFAPEKAEVTGLRLGALTLVGIPGEPSSHLGRRIAARGRELGLGSVLVASHVNGWMGYILEADDMAKGGYEAALGFYGPEAAQRVFEAAERMLIRLGSAEARRRATA